MTIRLSKAEAARMGIKAPKKEGAKSPSKATRHVIDDAELLKQEAIFLSFPVPPQTKHRPRSFLVESSLRKAFHMARGNVEIFMKNIRMKTVTTKATRDFEKLISNTATVLMGRRAPLVGPVEIFVRFTLAGETNMWPTSRNDGDLDNHEKAFFDALNGIVYDDDCLIVRKQTEKVFGGLETNKIEVLARPARDITSLDHHFVDLTGAS